MDHSLTTDQQPIDNQLTTNGSPVNEKSIKTQNIPRATLMSSVSTDRGQMFLEAIAQLPRR